MLASDRVKVFPLTNLRFLTGEAKQVRLSLVYPADATPGHLLSVVPVQQLALLNRRRERQGSKSNIENQKGRRNSHQLHQRWLTGAG